MIPFDDSKNLLFVQTRIKKLLENEDNTKLKNYTINMKITLDKMSLLELCNLLSLWFKNAHNSKSGKSPYTIESAATIIDQIVKTINLLKSE
jgi:hypothetical protein